MSETQHFSNEFSKHTCTSSVPFLLQHLIEALPRRRPEASRRENGHVVRAVHLTRGMGEGCWVGRDWRPKIWNGPSILGCIGAYFCKYNERVILQKPCCQHLATCCKKSSKLRNAPATANGSRSTCAAGARLRRRDPYRGCRP